MTAGICSSIAVFIVSILIAVTGLCLMLTERDFKVLLKLGAACIPNLIYMGIYVVVAYSYLL
jgi:ABC-type multidrug transport system permease subunit